MSKPTISERLGYVLAKEYELTSKLDLDTLSRALVESSSKRCGKGGKSGKVIVRVRRNRVTVIFYTLRGGALMGPVFKGLLRNASDGGCTLRGKFEMMWYEKLGFSLGRIGSPVTVLESIYHPPQVTTGHWEDYIPSILPVIVSVIVWPLPHFCWRFAGSRIDLMIGHLRDLGFAVP